MTIEEKRVEEAVQLVDLTIDGQKVTVPAGTLIIRAAERIGVRIPRFCDHPLLKPVAACRQCLVEVARPGRDGVVAKGPKPVPSCAEAVSPGMEVYTQNTSEVARKAQRGMIEFLLVNHPLDCPVCDKGGECPLQNQALSDGRESSRFVDVKRTYPKPVEVSSQILLDRDRCILCQRCTRFQSQIAGDPFIALQGRGGGSPRFEVRSLNGSQIGNFDARVLNFSDSDGGSPEAAASRCVGSRGAPGMAEGFATGPLEPGETDESGRPFSSYFSGNVIQICPVGALTSAAYRFRSRPFDLVSVPGVTEHDASGSAIRVDYRRGEVLRRLAGEDPDVNEEWITDKDRFAFRWASGADRLTHPLVRDESGELVPTSWADALDVAARGLARAREGKGVGVLTGGRLTMEDAYAYSKFARVVLGTNDIDFRTRPQSAEEDAFLASTVAGAGLGVTYADLTAGHVLAVAFEAEEECGSVFLRLRKAALAGTAAVSVVAPFATRGTAKMQARLIPAAPGREAAVLDGLAPGDPTFDALAEKGVVLVGERASEAPGALSAAVRLAARTGARLAWIPRRAGDRGALDMGAMGALLPGGARRRRSRVGRTRPRDPRPVRAGHPRRRRRGRALRPADRRRRTRRPPRRRPGRRRGGGLRRPTGGARQRGRRTRRRRPPRGPAGREGRVVRQLGGPHPAVRPGAHLGAASRSDRPRRLGEGDGHGPRLGHLGRRRRPDPRIPGVVRGAARRPGPSRRPGQARRAGARLGWFG